MPPQQLSLDQAGAPLYDVTFVVLDLETTGGSPANSRITEVGAVKVRCGEVLGEFATLVDPGVPIPAAITALTGITASMVTDRPPIEAVLPALLEFCRGAVLVAHNARFDTGFLNANLRRLSYPPLENPVVCTATLARRAVRDEVRNCRLATLARFFRARTEPVHRALADARATVDVFHGLLERAGSFGVVTLEDLVDFARVRNTPLFKARRGIAAGLPAAPGVYAFRSPSGEVLYVGKATDLRARVRGYFGSDDRRKIVDLLKEAEAVDHWVCPTPLEAAVREARLIRAHRPRFNRRGKPGRSVWLKLTAERYPRLSVVRDRRADEAAYLGPLPSRRAAEQVADALYEAAPVRRCTVPIRARTRFPACALAELGRCPAPCDRDVEPAAYARAIAAVTAALQGDLGPAAAVLEARMRGLAAAGRFEDAGRTRDRLEALVQAVLRARTRRWLEEAGELAAARPAPSTGGVEVVLIRRGRLVASATCGAGEVVITVERLRAEDATAGTGSPPASPSEPDGADEALLVAAWLERRGTVVVDCTGTLADAVAGGATLARLHARLRSARRPTGRAESELASKRLRRPAAGVAAG